MKTLRRVRPMAERFWEKVNVRGADECWPWTGKPNDYGYGQFRKGRAGSVSTHAQRVAFELATGSDPGRLWVLHRCDNPPCCNPAHLFLGTNLDNVADRQAKGRQARGARTVAHRLRRGEANNKAKLTADDVRGMRFARTYAGATYDCLARAFGVHKSQAAHIVTGKQWRHV